MDITNRFSLMDFLAYFFPGVVGTSGIYLFLLLTPLKSSLSISSVDLTVGLVVLSLSYIIGVILAGFSNSLVLWLHKIAGKKNPRESILLGEFENEVKVAFNDTFGRATTDKVQWSEKHFLLCRSLVIEYMPNMAQIAQRQNSLAQLRQNLIMPILIWACAGISWGIFFVLNNNRTWGIVVITLSILLAVIVSWITLIRKNYSKEREVAFVLAAFLIGYRTGAYGKKHEGMTTNESTK